MKKVILAIDGMTCSACSNGLEKYLNKQSGIEKANVNLVMNTAYIEYDNRKLKIDDLNSFVKKAGFKSLGVYNPEKEQKQNKLEKNRVVALLMIAIITCYISMSHMLNLPDIYINRYPINYAFSLFILSIVVMILGWHIIKNGINNLIHKTPNMDSLVTISIASCFIYSLYGTSKMIINNFDYNMHLYYDSIAMVICLIEIGKYIENKNKNKTKEAIQKLVTITPKNANILKDGKETVVTIDEINRGDIVICKPGEKIAVDGRIIDGKTHIDESFITGESFPIKKDIDSVVIAGSINYDGTIKYKAEKIGRNSTVSEIVRMVVEASNSKAPIARIADKVSGYFVPTIILLALFTFIIWLSVGKSLEFSINSFVSVLLVACPCSLGLATPLAIVISTGICTRKGILIKSSDALENAYKVKNIVFDKTGTITKGKLSVSKIINFSNDSDTELMKNIASIEKNSEHPIAKAIINYADEQELELIEIKDFKAIAGYGICAKIDGDEYYIGNKKLMDKNKVKIIKIEEAEELSKNGNSILFVSKNRDLQAIVGVKDTIRKDIKQFIEKLKKKNIRITVLTGDNEKTAESIANEVGIENIIANADPKEKAKTINQYKKDGIVLMCGDGINDSISLVSADIGVSISNGTDIAIDSAKIILMNNNIEKINDLIEISLKTIKNIKQNLFWAFFYNICMIPVAIGVLSKYGIVLNPMIASLAMTLSSLTVVLNALRLKVICK